MALKTERLKSDRDRRIRRRGLEITNVLQTRPDGLDRDSAKKVIEIADGVIREAKTELTAEDNEWLQTILVPRPDGDRDRSPYSFSLTDLRMTFPSWKEIRPAMLAVIALLTLNLIATVIGLAS